MVNAALSAPAVISITPDGDDEDIGVYLRTMKMCFSSELNSNHCSFRFLRRFNLTTLLWPAVLKELIIYVNMSGARGL
ncbi:hypothetical protein L1887_22858 [Cichorium endivia]|nr:hypothetical protein L1887_22858 [Cichorium endivia]